MLAFSFLLAEKISCSAELSIKKLFNLGARKACASVQSDQGLCSLLTTSLETLDNADEKKKPISGCMMTDDLVFIDSFKIKSDQGNGSVRLSA